MLVFFAWRAGTLAGDLIMSYQNRPSSSSGEMLFFWFSLLCHHNVEASLPPGSETQIREECLVKLLKRVISALADALSWMCICVLQPRLVIKQFHCYDDEPSVSSETIAAFYLNHPQLSRKRTP